jgi:dTMP kinase
MYFGIEGIDTAGKSTQLELLKREYPDALFIKEPGFTSIGGKIRQLLLEEEPTPLCELFLFLADRAETIGREVAPSLQRGRAVFSDRTLISGIAYGKGLLPREELIHLNRIATGNIFPDGIILLKLDRETLRQRLEGKSRDRIEERGIEYLLNVQREMEEVTRELGIPLYPIDGTQPVPKVYREIKRVIDGFLG